MEGCLGGSAWAQAGPDVHQRCSWGRTDGTSRPRSMSVDTPPPSRLRRELAIDDVILPPEFAATRIDLSLLEREPIATPVWSECDPGSLPQQAGSQHPTTVAVRGRAGGAGWVTQTGGYDTAWGLCSGVQYPEDLSEAAYDRRHASCESKERTIFELGGEAALAGPLDTSASSAPSAPPLFASHAATLTEPVPMRRTRQRAPMLEYSHSEQYPKRSFPLCAEELARLRAPVAVLEDSVFTVVRPLLKTRSSPTAGLAGDVQPSPALKLVLKLKPQA